MTRTLFCSLGLFSALLLSSCSFVSHKALPIISEKETYKATLVVEVNGKKFKGVGVIPLATEYKFKVKPEGKIDRIIWRTCNGEKFEDKPKTGWFNNNYEFKTAHSNHLESESSCGGLEITVMQEKKRLYAFSTLEYKDLRPEYNLGAKMVCNMDHLDFNGVGICQSASGLIQLITFNDIVYHGGTPLMPECDVVPKGEFKTFQFKLAPGICTYVFTADKKASNGKRYKFRLTTRGYTDAPPFR